MATKVKKHSVAYDIEHQKGVSPDQILAELLGSELESSQDPTAAGDKTNGVPTSFGIFQIHLPAHPGITQAQAENVKEALKLWKGAYRGGVESVGAKLFKTDPELAAEEAADYAERPNVNYYQGQGTATVDAKFKIAQEEFEGDTSLSPSAGQSASAKTLPVPSGSTKVLASELHAAKVLSSTTWDGAKLSGNNLLVTLAALGAQTNGTYDETTLDNFVKALHGGAIPDSDLLTNHYSEVDPYLASADAALGKIGLHPKYTGNPDGGDPGVAKPQGVTGGAATGAAKDALSGLDSIGKLIEWITDPDNLLRVGLIALGAVLVIVGIIRLSGGSVPSAVPIPVPV
jgi:hypothetical protein